MKTPTLKINDGLARVEILIPYEFIKTHNEADVQKYVLGLLETAFAASADVE